MCIYCIFFPPVFLCFFYMHMKRTCLSSFAVELTDCERSVSVITLCSLFILQIAFVLKQLIRGLKIHRTVINCINGFELAMNVQMQCTSGVKTLHEELCTLFA